MKKYPPIEAVVPQPMRRIGIIFTLCGIITVIGYFWRIFVYPEPPDDEMLLMAWVSFVTGPLWCVFALPLFINRYPAWVVSLVGPKYIHRLIADCKTKLGKNRAEKAHILLPHAWFADHLVFWIVVIGGAFVLGVFKGMGWL
jgi:hypothetical protein